MKYRVPLGWVVVFCVGLGFAAGADWIPAPPPARILELADANHDGFVTYGELRALMPGLTQQLFNSWDATGEGFLDIADSGVSFPLDLLESSSVAMNAVDADNDGVISFKEALTALPSLTREEFDRLDANGDGVLSAEDVPPLPQDETGLMLYELLEATEVDGFADVTFAEAQQYCPDLTQVQFNEMDCNGDGLLSRADFPQSAGSDLGSSVLERTVPVSEKRGYLEKAAKAGQIAVPNVVGLAQATARTAITNALLALGTSAWQYSASVASGNVMSEMPVAGTLVASGTAVNLVVSYGKTPIVVPNVVGDTQSTAQAAIAAATLALGTISKQYSTTAPANDVISQIPSEGTLVAAATPIDLVVSLGAPATTSVPNVVNLTQSNAQAAITAAGLTVGTTTQQHSATVPAGSVISQNPAPGASVAPGTAINLVVSQGTPPVSVPNVVNLTQSNAQSAITAAGLAVGTITQQHSATVPAGSVISQNPAAGASVAPGTAINLVVSEGPPPTAAPNVVGMTQSDAQTTIATAGFILGAITQQYSATVPAGSVISQNPAPGTLLSLGTAISLVISEGPQLVTVPSLAGMSQVTALATINSAGLTVGAVTQQASSTVAAGNVIGQDPAAGQSVAAGSAVNIIVSTGPIPVIVPYLVGAPQSRAQTAIINAGLKVGAITTQSSATVPTGDVISQDPAGGMTVPPGTLVNLVVSTGPLAVTVPNVVGMVEIDANTTLTRAGLVLGGVAQQYSETVPSGDVISQDPAAGASVSPGTGVNLIVSIGHDLNTGISVTIEPAGAVTAGAQWSVDGGPWQDSGATVTGLSAGGHTVTFKTTVSQQSAGCFGPPAEQWTTPAAQAVTVTEGQTTTVTGTYATAKAALAGFGTNGATGDMLLMTSAAATLLLVRKNRLVKVKTR